MPDLRAARETQATRTTVKLRCALAAVWLCAGVVLCTARASAQAATPLGNVLGEVRAQSPSLAAARARISAARRTHDAAGKPNDPMLSIEVDRVGWARGAGRPMLRYTLQQPIPTPGTLGMDQRVAERATEQVEADHATLQRDLESDVAHGYVMVWRTQGELDVVESQRHLVEDSMSAALARMASGADAHHDVLQSQVELATLRDRLVQIGAERTTAVALVNALRNRAGAALIATEPFALPAQVEPVAELEAQALRARPELRSVGAMAAGERAMATLARREGWPMFSVGAWYTQDLAMPDSVGLMVSGTLPVFGASRQSSRASASLARAGAADADRQALELMIRSQVQAAWARYAATNERVTLLHDTALPLAEQSLMQSLSSYRTGMTTFTTVLLDERMLTELRMQLLAARAERYDAYVALLRATARDLTTAPIASN
ncbi:MAG TPA: TolC family protein [Polyangiales bacterium]